MTDTLTLLRDARTRLADPTTTLNKSGEYFASQIQHQNGGFLTEVFDHNCMCTSGALLQAINPTACDPEDLSSAGLGMFNEARFALIDQLPERYLTYTDSLVLEDWNDAEDTTLADVIALFDKAIHELATRRTVRLR